MTETEFQGYMAALGWTVPDAARELGRSVATIFRYQNGSVPVPDPVAKLLRMMAIEVQK